MEPPVPPGPVPPGPVPPSTAPPPSPAASIPPPMRPIPGRPQYRPVPCFLVRARADRRLVIGALAGGILFDVAVHSGVATVAVTGWLAVIAAAMLLGGRVRGIVSKVLLAAVPVIGLLFALRSSPWVIVPVSLAELLLLFLGVSLGADGGGVAQTFPALINRFSLVIGHLVVAPGMFRFTAEAGRDDMVQKRAAAVVRGVLLGLPVMIVVGLLLATADPIFRSWFDLGPLLEHLAVVLAGAWVVVGLARAASARDPSPAAPPAPSLGTVEVSFVLGGLCALYGAFVAAQFVALSGAGHRILVTHGLTYAQYARGGFFHLLACAAITLVVLLGVRACSDKTRLIPASFAGLTTALTLGVVFVAIRRLQLYEAAYGLTMLRLASLVAAIWIGVVFVLLAMTIVPRALPARLFPAAMIASGLVLVGAWGISNPASIVATIDLHRAEHGHRLDVRQAVRLGPDAMPALVAGLPHLDVAADLALRRAICARSAEKDAGTAFNLARAMAAHAISQACRKSGFS